MNREGQNQPAKPVRLRWYAETIREARQALRCGRVDRDTLAMAHLPVGIDVVRRLAQTLGAHEDIPDWVQEAAIALLKAADYYLQKRPNVPFPKYAAGAVYRHLRRVWRKTRPVFINEHLTADVLNFSRLVNDAIWENRSPTDEELAQALGIPTKRVRELWRVREVLQLPPRSLDEPLQEQRDDSMTLGDTIADDTASVEEQALTAIEREEREQELRRALQHLPESFRLAIALTTGYKAVEETDAGEVLAVMMSYSRQQSARRKLQRVFREEAADARRLGFEPEDAVGVSRGSSPLSADIAPGRPGADHRRYSAEDIWRSIADRFGQATTLDAAESLGA